MSQVAGGAPWLGAEAIDLAELILASHYHAWGRPLVAGTGPGRCRRQAAQELFAAVTLGLKGVLGTAENHCHHRPLSSVFTFTLVQELVSNERGRAEREVIPQRSDGC
jgi:hypothetical protein